MKAFFLAIGIFLLYKYLQAKYQLGHIKEKYPFNLKQVNQLIDIDHGNAIFLLVCEELPLICICKIFQRHEMILDMHLH